MLHVVRFLHAVFAPQVTPFRSAFRVAIFQQCRRLLRCSSPKIHSHQRRRAGCLAPRHEFIQSELIRLDGIPGLLHHPRPFLFWPNAIEPVISRHKISAWITHNRHTHRFDFIRYIGPKSVCVRQLRTRLVNPFVNRAPQVLQERSKNVPVDGANCPSRIQIDPRCRRIRALRPGFSCQSKICRESCSRHRCRLHKLSARFHRHPPPVNVCSIRPLLTRPAILYIPSILSWVFLPTAAS